MRSSVIYQVISRHTHTYAYLRLLQTQSVSEGNGSDLKRLWIRFVQKFIIQFQSRCMSDPSLSDVLDYPKIILVFPNVNSVLIDSKMFSVLWHQGNHGPGAILLVRGSLMITIYHVVSPYMILLKMIFGNVLPSRVCFTLNRTFWHLQMVPPAWNWSQKKRWNQIRCR